MFCGSTRGGGKCRPDPAQSTSSDTGPGVIGPIGAARFAVHEAIAARITGASFFSTQMHDGMKQDELFGQIDMTRHDARAAGCATPAGPCRTRTWR